MLLLWHPLSKISFLPMILFCPCVSARDYKIFVNASHDFRQVTWYDSIKQNSPNLLCFHFWSAIICQKIIWAFLIFITFSGEVYFYPQNFLNSLLKICWILQKDILYSSPVFLHLDKEIRFLISFTTNLRTNPEPSELQYDTAISLMKVFTLTSRFHFILLICLLIYVFIICLV